MKCPNCGKEVPKGKSFCGYCGADLIIIKKEIKTAQEPKKKESKSTLEDKPIKTEGLPKDSKVIQRSPWKEYYRPSILITLWWFAATLLCFPTYVLLFAGSLVSAFLLMFILCISVPSIWINSKLKNRYQGLKKEILIIILIWVALDVLNYVLFINSDFSLGFLTITSTLAFFASLISLYLINRA